MSVRRQIRLRREFLYRKSLEGKERDVYEKKRSIQEALAEGRALPSELKAAEANLRQSSSYDPAVESKNGGGAPIDDEYASTLDGARPPKVCVTTSRDPSSRLKQFAKEIKLMFPNAQRVNRGTIRVAEVVDACRSSDFTDIVVVQETRGQPDGLIISHLPLGPTAFFTLSNCVLRHDIAERAPISEALPHLALEGFGDKSRVGQRVATILRCLFPPPPPDSRRIITFANQSDYISFRHHNYNRTGRDIALNEVGPRFEMRLYQIRLGTLDQPEADNEYVLRPYMSSAKKRRAIA